MSNFSLKTIDVEKARDSVGKLQPIQIYFKDLHFSVKLPESRKLLKSKNVEEKPQYKHILKGISGTINPGSLVAIMGSSGAGKTTLLNLLAGRAQGKTEGQLLINGVPLDESKELRKHSTYIMQDDILLANQTPREILSFSAKMKISSEYTEEERSARINEVIAELNLKNCENTRVGAPGISRGISGGERKRVAIGNEIIDNPSLLFVDEPTSGLDSSMAESVVKSLRDLAQTGRTVITTIHQPNSDIYEMFDQLMLLAAGNIVYFGPGNKAVEYFASIGYPCKAYTNPADFFMKLIHIEPNSEEGATKLAKLVAAYKSSEMYRENQNSVAERIPFESTKSENKASRCSFFTQLGALVYRNMTEAGRNPLVVRAAAGQTIFLALIMGLMYLRIGDGQSTIQDRLGSLFFVLVNLAMSSTTQVVTTFTEQRAVFFREHSNNMYSTIAFYIAKIVADFPLQVFFPALFSTIVYWMVGFVPDAGKYFIFLGINILCSNVGNAYGMLLGAVAKDSNVALTLQPVVLIPFVIFSGYFINSENVPPYFIWIEYISFVKYGFHSLVINEFSALKFTCTEAEQILTPTGPTCPVNSGGDVIRNLGFDDGISIGVDAAILVGLFIVARILTYMVLSYKAKKAANA